MAIRLESGLSPDLGSERATSVQVTAGLPQPAVEALLKQLNLSPANAAEAIFVSDYTKARRKHQGFATFQGTRGRGSSLSVLVLYDLLPVSFGKEARPITELFDPLSELAVQSDAECVGNFEYPAAAWESILTLPWRPLRMPNLPFDELRGFRAVKRGNGDLLYSLIIDRPTNRDISHSITFSFSVRLDKNLPLTVLERARDISRLFVLPKATVPGQGRDSE